MFVYNPQMLGGLTAAVDEIVGGDIALMTDAAVRAEFVELRRENDRLAAREAQLLAALHHRMIPLADGAGSPRAWVEWKTGQRRADARASLDAGLACEEMPLLAKAWQQGEISAC